MITYINQMPKLVSLWIKGILENGLNICLFKYLSQEALICFGNWPQQMNLIKELRVLP